MGLAADVSVIIKNNTFALNNMRTVLSQLQNTMSAAEQQQKQYKETLQKTEQVEKKVAKTRSQAATMLTKSLEEQNKQVNLLSYETFKNFKTVTGQGNFISALEYADLLLSNNSQSLKIFGVEVATARKIFYGFLPPGTFRLFNQVSTGIRFVSQSMRAMSDESQEANNIFTTTLKLFGKYRASNIFKEGTLKKTERKQTQARIESFEQRIAGGETLSDSQQEVFEKLKARKITTTFQRRRQQISAIGTAIGTAGTAGYMKLQKTKDFLHLQVLKAQQAVKPINLLKLYTKLPTWKQIGSALNPITLLMKLLKTPLMNFLLTVMLYMTGIMVIVMLFKEALLPALNEAWTFVKENSGLFLDGLATIWGAIGTIWEGIMSGDFVQVVMGIFDLAWGVVKVALGLLWIAAGALFTLAFTFVKTGFDKLINWISTTFTSVESIKKNAGKIALGIVLLIGFFFGLPAMLVAIGVGVVLVAAKWIYGKFKSFFGFKASGGRINTPLTVVGESGPEILVGNRGSNVVSNAKSRRMLNEGGNTINITINARDTSDAELKRISKVIGQQVMQSITRKTGSFSTIR